jgi:dihydroorotate dehydrogenase (fumarate)
VLRWITETYPGLPIPIAASGGVSNGGDVAKYLLAGATTVQVCTAIVLEGYQVVGKILEGLVRWMEAKGYQSPDDFRGAVCPKIRSNDEVERRQTCVADIDADKCVNCGLCARVCIYGAAQKSTAKHVVDGDRCVGCGLCAELCPVGAIRMALLPEPRGFTLGVK